jgi:hypothetical protein
MIQAIIFDVDLWTPRRAETWLKKNAYIPIKSVHTTSDYHRYRLIDPDQFKHFYTQKDKKTLGIYYIIGIKNDYNF